jgi:hypothetical protein
VEQQEQVHEAEEQVQEVVQNVLMGTVYVVMREKVRTEVGKVTHHVCVMEREKERKKLRKKLRGAVSSCSVGHTIHLLWPCECRDHQTWCELDIFPPYMYICT